MILRPLTLTGIIISIVTGMAAGVLAYQHLRDKHPAPTAVTLDQALRQVASSYVEQISEEELLGFALDGMMRGLDEHSSYLNAKDFESLEVTTTGRFGGIGIELGLVDGYFTIVTPLDATPAAAAGLKAGDRITQLDHASVKGWKLIEVIEHLRGEPGSPVSISVLRGEAQEALTFDLKRSTITLQSVTGRLLEPGFGYIRIAQFQNDTGRSFLDTLEKLQAESAATLAGIVLDLRNNPGGTLHASVEVVDHLLEQGLIVYTEGRLTSSHAKYKATGRDVLEGAPIVVLINRGSASASEIVAGALQDHGRAVLLGTTSYGKGSVQSVLPLDDTQAIKLTTAYYYTPKGRSIHKHGIEPDQTFTGGEASILAEALNLLKRQKETRQARL